LLGQLDAVVGLSRGLLCTYEATESLPFKFIPYNVKKDNIK